jgi:uncharacterized Zn finger protein
MNKRELVDSLGAIKAEIATLTAREKVLKDKLIALGESAIDGDMYRATVSTSERETLDMSAVRAKLSPQFMAAHTNVTTVTAVRVVARIRDAA